jgi:L-serine dehydratase
MSIPSIFNDVIGPVMRGPSSSHSAAAVRIGRIGRELMAGVLSEVTVCFDRTGSLPTTYLSQGSAMGLGGGLLGFDAADQRLIDYRRELQQAGLKVEYITGNFGDHHPNTYNLTLKNSAEEHRLVAISTGGGMIELTAIDDRPVSFFGDCYALAIWTQDAPPSLVTVLEGAGCTFPRPESSHPPLLFVLRQSQFDHDLLQTIRRQKGVKLVRPIFPVLPILTSAETTVPFTTARELASFAGKGENLADLALSYEAARGNISREAVLEKMVDLVEILDNSIKIGLQGTQYQDRILGYQSARYTSALQAGRMLNLGLLDRIIPYVTALMEVKSAMGVIVAAPTAGSCGGLPGSVLAVADAMAMDSQAKARGLLAGGLIGALIATRSTFSAELCGCQAECGVSSGMIAGAVATMLGADAAVALGGASMALQNIFGMVCDPVAGRVEVPCLGKNILAASNGVSCANLALAGFDQVIPFDETVEAMDRVGRALPHELRCTALGGLSITPSSKLIEKRLAGHSL